MEHLVASILIFVLGLSGFCMNLFIVSFIRQVPSLRNSFGQLTRTQAATDLLNCFLFMAFVAPAIARGESVPVWLSSIVGRVLFLGYDMCCLVHLAITVNRFFALYKPLWYHSVFTAKTTPRIIASLWTIGILTNILNYTIADCSFFLPDNSWNFDFLQTWQCELVQWYSDYCKYMTITVFIAVLDFATIFLYRKAKAKLSFRQSRPFEKFLLIQALSQSALFFIESVCCYNLGGLDFMQGRWAQFVLRTVLWVAVHAVDGAITLICNHDFRFAVNSIAHGKRPVSSVAAQISPISRKQPSLSSVRS